MSAVPKGRKRSYIRSIQACDAELASNPHDASLLGRRGEAKRKLGLNESAIVDFDAALSISPSSVLALAGRGAAKRALGKHEEAVADFDCALQLEPRNAPLLVGRSTVLRHVGRAVEALADLDLALQLDPGNAGALQQRGEVRRKLGDLEQALADFNSALRIEPHCVPALAGRGAAKRSLGKQAECIADYDAALRLEPRNASVLAGRGAAKLELGRYEEALSDFDRALEINPLDAYAKWGRSMAVRQEGRAPLQTITLNGFVKSDMNIKYVERRQLEFTVNDCETYWSESGEYFIYWCQKETRWKGSRASDLPEVQGGRNCGFVGSPLGADILSPSFSKGWYEYDGTAWVLRPNAGISSIGLLTAVPQTLTLAGFAKEDMNVQYLERRQPEFTVAGRETYWSFGGRYFLYWSKKESRWKGARSADLLDIQGGRSIASFIGSRVGSDLLSPQLRKGWHEWDGTGWAFRPDAGIVAAGLQEPRPAAHVAAKAGGSGNAGAVAAPVREHSSKPQKQEAAKKPRITPA